MKLVSWNVNGVRAALEKGLLDYLVREDADVYCLQEVKAVPGDVAHVPWPTGYEVHWNAARKPGYSGTAVLTRVRPLAVTRGVGEPVGDDEGRVISVEFPSFHLVNVYTPNAQAELTRLEFRTKVWDPAFRAHLQRLDAAKPVVFCGDLNVAHEPIDLARPKENEGASGFTAEEREEFSRHLAAGFFDSFRALHPGEAGRYSWWSYRAGARRKNIGWRIDYFGLSQRLRPGLQAAFIRPDVLGSDHCPVGIELAA